MCTVIIRTLHIYIIIYDYICIDYICALCFRSQKPCFLGGSPQGHSPNSKAL